LDGNELRLDALGHEAILTPQRSRRPKDFATQRPVKTTLPSKCFFCPGNEHLTPPEIARIAHGGKWAVRCFPNKFPAFDRGMPKAYGRHEVIVETPGHYKTLSELSEANFADYLELVKRRVEDAYSDPKIKYVQVFKNEGHEAGASLEHSHTQLVAMPRVPFLVERQAALSGGGFFENLRKSGKKRIFAQNAQFFALCPAASRFHFESWIVPKGKISSITALNKAELGALAKILRTVLFRTDCILNFPPYNIIFYFAPPGAKWRMSIQVLPRLSKWAGFEFGTGIVMNSMMPEAAARALSGRKA
jgi:UDPglucose--hexose-1-phosphate uridylyltransferase